MTDNLNSTWGHDRLELVKWEMRSGRGKCSLKIGEEFPLVLRNLADNYQILRDFDK